MIDIHQLNNCLVYLAHTKKHKTLMIKGKWQTANGRWQMADGDNNERKTTWISLAWGTMKNNWRSTAANLPSGMTRDEIREHTKLWENCLRNDYV